MEQNKVKLVGMVSSYPKVRDVGQNSKLLKFRVTTTEPALNRNNGSTYIREDTHWIVVWGRERCEKALKTLSYGDKVVVEGSLRNKLKRSFGSFREYVCVEASSIKKSNTNRLENCSCQPRDIFNGKF